MRKITREAVDAFYGKYNFNKANTSVVNNYASNPEAVYLFLHNNLIARLNTNTGLEVSLAGWNTNTTRERLNGLHGVKIHTKNGQAYLNGQPIDTDTFYTIS